jgi:hypothetical protein
MPFLLEIIYLRDQAFLSARQEQPSYNKKMGWELADLSIKCVGICVAESSVCNLDSHFTSLRWIHLNILNNKRLLGLPCNGSCKS